MPCATITVAPSVPVIRDLYLEDRGGGNVFVQWYQDRDGDVYVILDANIPANRHRVSGRASTNNITLTGVPAANHTICVVNV